MYQDERLRQIVEHLSLHKRISIDEICSLFDVSRDTARRDLVKLEEQRAIIRTRGGAILSSKRHEVKNYQYRLTTVSEEKKKIGQKAASLISKGERVILDASTTVQAAAEFLDVVECTVITNSINQADILSQHSTLRIHLMGGELEKEHRFLYGASVVERLSHYHVEKAFIGVVGISENGLTIAHVEDGIVKQQMMKQAEQVIVLADHSKFGVTDFFQFATLKDVDMLITDQIPPDSFIEMLSAYNVELIVTEEDEIDD
ncbi:DeoR/GlpR family DNA-binding transcription regulator [Jeotgalibacillus soli]|uniref:DeoR family transcriptional regulator n=1 Tax=Jeotgalibacillus soli TaxID=889306 RepID=A0A0C2VYT0_9BACL|nr:DeoR/GlpR family DNA-binding transcription regulator [Jeotgalibacillus soli]KIL49536.1 DeoR family transcriptional regulator [Jeotgalibacillus soli]